MSTEAGAIQLLDVDSLNTLQIRMRRFVRFLAGKFAALRASEVVACIIFNGHQLGVRYDK